MRLKKLSRYGIKNVRYRLPGKWSDRCSVWIEQGSLVKIGQADKVLWSDAEVFDGDGLDLLPCGADAHVHLRSPGQWQKETPECARNAAIAGGFSTLLAMPNTYPTIDNLENLNYGKDSIADAFADSGLLVLWASSVTKNLGGQTPVFYEKMHKHGGVCFFTDDGHGVQSEAMMRQILSFVVRSGTTFCQHAEMAPHKGCLAAGPLQERLKMPPYPHEAEVDMVRRDLDLIKTEFPQARYHVMHVSSPETVQLVSLAKSQGLKVSCEVTPHHLFFSSDSIDSKNLGFKMNPPLRDTSTQRELCRLLESGDIDFVASDHAPHDRHSKEGSSDGGEQRFTTASFGTLGLESTLPSLYTLHKDGVFSIDRLLEVYATQPAAFLGVKQNSVPVVGEDFRFILFDPSVERDFAPQQSLSQNSCFTNSRLRGEVVRTFLGTHVWGPRP